MHYMTRIVYKAAVGEDDKWGEHEVDYILLAVADVNCDINLNEVSEIRYVSKEELKELLAQEERQEIMLSPWFKAVAQRWLPMWWEALIAGKVDSVKDTEKIFIIGD
jgi:isopentenyl-diphosphate delta-isomerase